VNPLSSSLRRFRLSRFIQGEKLSKESVTLNHQRIFILPTRNGLGFVVLITILLLIAFVYNNNLIYILAFLLASVFFVTIIHSFKSLAGLSIKKGKSNAVFAGEAAPFNVHLENSGDNQHLSLQVNLSGENPVQTHLTTSNNAHVTLYALTNKRGWFQCGTITVSSNFPLGLFRAWSPINFDYRTLVYPKPAELETPFPDNSSISTGSGIPKKNREDFFGLTRYQPGHSLRQIHWKALAKGQGLHSKEYMSQQNSELWLDYQYTPGRDLEERLSQLCRWLIDAEKYGFHYGLKISGIKKKPASGMKHLQDCLEALALF
jgi:uncharacterized protein (DUF58 family)